MKTELIDHCIIIHLKKWGNTPKKVTRKPLICVMQKRAIYAIQINGVKTLHNSFYCHIASWSNMGKAFYQQGKNGQALYYEYPSEQFDIRNCRINCTSEFAYFNENPQ